MKKLITAAFVVVAGTAVISAAQAMPIAQLDQPELANVISGLRRLRLGRPSRSVRRMPPALVRPGSTPDRGAACAGRTGSDTPIRSSLTARQKPGAP